MIHPQEETRGIIQVTLLPTTGTLYTPEFLYLVYKSCVFSMFREN